MSYDGTGSISKAIAGLCGLSLKSQAQIAKQIAQAKTALGITSKSKNLPVDTKLAIYRWHWERLHPAAVEIPEPVKTQALADDYTQTHFNLTVTHDGKARRTTIMLERFFINALQVKHGLGDNRAVRQWLESAIANDDSFDAGASLTKQVVRMIVESLIK